MLNFSDIKKSYGKTEIIKGVSGEIHQGEITALIGPSGSGKSTLIRLLSLLENPDSGKIEYDNGLLDFSNKKITIPSDYWPNVTVVFQQLYLWPHLTMMDNILLPHKNNSSDEKWFKEKLDYLINFFELNEYLGRYPNQLSIGQRQRIAIIRAIMLNPKYILFDEVTASLDIEHIQKVKEVLLKEKAEGKGIIIATHLIGFAKAISDNIWFLEKGKFIEQGTKEILNKPKTERFSKFLSLIE